MKSLDILERLIAFPTVSSDTNLELIEFVRATLADHGIDSELVHDETGRKANLFATVGPRHMSGVVLSGHTDVVPVEGQTWSMPPFCLTEKDGCLYGRGAADMKGFVAASLAAALRAADMDLAVPLHLALSYDEELGCLGVHGLLKSLAARDIRPRLCLVGEPTSMQVATGHKGKAEARVVCTGREAHSSLAPLAQNAIHLGCEFVSALRAEQARLVREGARDEAYDVVYSTLHVGVMRGGVSVNIVPNRCELEIELRHLPGDDISPIFDNLRREARRIEAAARRIAPEAAVELRLTHGYPGLDTPVDCAAVRLIQALTGNNSTTKVAFGTEGGLFEQYLGVPTVVCGPGSIVQAHKPDEFVTIDQMQRCDAMLDRLLNRLCAAPHDLAL
jgi:acetylornithine deacetylase